LFAGAACHDQTTALLLPAEPRYQYREKDSSMYKKLILAPAVLLLVAVAPLLSACHTTAGAGQDISASGKALENSAKKNTP
jgi:predicted small secreted protein